MASGLPWLNEDANQTPVPSATLTWAEEEAVESDSKRSESGCGSDLNKLRGLLTSDEQHGLSRQNGTHKIAWISSTRRRLWTRNSACSARSSRHANVRAKSKDRGHAQRNRAHCAAHATVP
ncbi:hypothetical protein CGCF413_v008753 [Colletotrichum fructicola]|nr:hypothetical protein CGCF413_v008753 [Colletotrichum fructicola]